MFIKLEVLPNGVVLLGGGLRSPIAFLVIIIITSDNKVEEVLFSPLFVCEQLPDHNFSCRVMKLSGNNCYIKIWK